MERLHPPRLGRVHVDGDHATLVFERRLEHPPEEVWKAITQPDEFAQWAMAKAKIDGRVGGQIEFVQGPSQFHITGTILAWDPPRVFEHEWNLDEREGSWTERSIVRWEIIPEEYGSLVKLTHSRLTKRASRGFVAGVHAFLDRLEAQLDNATLPDWIRRVEEMRPAYSQAPSQRNSP